MNVFEYSKKNTFLPIYVLGIDQLFCLKIKYYFTITVLII